MTEHDLSLQERRLTRANLYGVYARAFEFGLTPDIAGELRVIDERFERLTKPLDIDEAAADHYSLFGLNVLPFASSYLEGDGLLGGRATDVAVHFCRIAGVVVHQSTAPDHVGSELEILKQLSLATASQTSMGDPERRFMDEHLLWWLALFLPAVSRAAVQPYAYLADLLLDVVVSHRAELGASVLPETEALPPVPPILDDRHTGLRDVGRFLATPAYTGMVLLRSEVEELARRLELPRGFGDRRLMLANLLENCVEYNRLSDLMMLMGHIAEDWRRRHEVLALNEIEILGLVGREWARRARGAMDVLSRIAESTPAA